MNLDDLHNDEKRKKFFSNFQPISFTTKEVKSVFKELEKTNTLPTFDVKPRTIQCSLELSGLDLSQE